jgi:hypothetical protein
MVSPISIASPTSTLTEAKWVKVGLRGFSTILPNVATGSRLGTTLPVFNLIDKGYQKSSLSSSV